MKIAMVSEHASPLAALGGADAGGQNVHVEALARALGRRGHSVTVYTRRDDPYLPTTVPLDGATTVRHVDAGPPTEIPKDELLPYMDDLADRMRGEWLRDRPDVVHAHFWMSAVAALRAARDLGIPVTVTFHALGCVKRRHQGAADTSPPGRVAIETRIARESARVIATATEEVQELLALGADPASLMVVPCGVDVDHFRPVGPAADELWSPPLPGRPRRHRVLSLGRMVPRKGVDDVVRALAALPDSELVVAGGPAPQDLDDDAEYRRLRDVALDNGVLDRVRFVGRVARGEAPALIRSADVVVCAPWYEPFGIVPLEAMACGRPLVGTAVGGLLDSVVSGTTRAPAAGETGILVPPRDPAALAAALRSLLDDAARRSAMGRNAAERARAHYSWDCIAAATESAYAAVVPADDAVILQEA